MRNFIENFKSNFSWMTKRSFSPRFIWGIKQLFPFRYESSYRDSVGDEKTCIWRMWLGKCFKIKWGKNKSEKKEEKEVK